MADAAPPHVGRQVRPSAFALMTALWLSWICLIVVASLVAGVPYEYRRGIVPHGLWAPIPGLAGFFVGAVIFFVLRRVASTLAPSGEPDATESDRTWAPAIGFIAGAWPALYAMPNPEYYAFLPVPQLLNGHMLGILPMGLLLLMRWRHAKLGERRRWWLACMFAFTVHALWISTLGLQLIFALHYPLFEFWRLRIQGSGQWEENVRIGLLSFSAGGESRDFGGTAKYVVVEHCSWHVYHGAHRFESEGSSPHMCFEGASGAGFYYAGDGASHPALNQNVDGPLIGKWWWYADD